MKTYIVVQGPLTFPKQIIDCYSGYDNVIISTSEDQSNVEGISLLKDIFPIVISHPTKNHGFGNINLQCQTSFEGLKLVKSMEGTHAIKIRSDMTISNLDKFVEILYHKNKISFLCWHWHGYPVDYINYGKIDEMINYWDFYTEKQIPAELNLIRNFENLIEDSIDTFDKSKKYIDYFLGDLQNENVCIYWLSRNNLNLLSYANEKQTYSY